MEERQVWKYNIEFADYAEIAMPMATEILHVGMQRGTICLWCFVYPDEKVRVWRRFRIAGTGHPIKEKGLEYIGTVKMIDSSLIFHIFEIPTGDTKCTTN